MVKRNEFDPNRLYFQFRYAAWLGSDVVGGMRLEEQGLFLRLMCAQEIYGDLPLDIKLLSKLIGVRNTVVARWVQAWGPLVTHVQHACSTGDAGMTHAPSRFVIPDGRKFAVSVAKQALPVALSRVEKSNTTQSREEDGSSPASASGDTRSRQEGKQAVPEIVALTKLLFSLAGEPAKWRSAIEAGEWYDAIAPLPTAANYQHIEGVIRYAAEHEYWGTGLRSAKVGPAAWLAERFLDIEAAMQTDAEFEQKRAAKSAKPVVVKNDFGKGALKF